MEKSGSERTALRRFGDSGMMLLPWTKQILCVVWEHLRLLVQIICCTLMTVFQMFRFEVHLRITDETGQHIQHMTSGSGDPTDSFLLSSLFENNKNMVVGGSKFARDPFDVSSHSRAVLSSLVNDDLCCSLVDDFVSHATECLTDSEDLYIGDRSVWKHGYDWSVFGGSERKCDENTCPLSFAACMSGFSSKEILKHDKPTTSSGSSAEDPQVPCQPQPVGQFSDSEFSWGSTDSSCLEGDREENDRLWDLLTSSGDPYHPLHFTANLSSVVAATSKAEVIPKPVQKAESPTSSLSAASTSSDSSKPGSEDEEEALWRSLSQNDDPYHPLNFRAPLQSSPATPSSKHSCDSPSDNKLNKTVNHLQSSRHPKPPLLSKKVARHRCHRLSDVETSSVVPWRRHVGQTAGPVNQMKCHTLKKVKFSPIIEVHRMRAWTFALQASRKGKWEELARDRDRFRKRINETEKAIGYCFSISHREKLWAYKDSLQLK